MILFIGRENRHIDDAFLIPGGNQFLKVGAVTLNSQSPYDLSRDTDICNSI